MAKAFILVALAGALLANPAFADTDVEGMDVDIDSTSDAEEDGFSNDVSESDVDEGMDEDDETTDEDLAGTSELGETTAVAIDAGAQAEIAEAGADPVATKLRYTTTASMNSTCSPGVCGKGKWEVFIGDTTLAKCKEICDKGRQLIKEPISERRYAYHHIHHRGSLDMVGFPKGYIKITTAGEYTFTTKSDEGSWLWIDDKNVVTNPGHMGMKEESGKVQLSAGQHKLFAEVLDHKSQFDTNFLMYSGPDTNGLKIKIPADKMDSERGSNTRYVVPNKPTMSALCVAYSHNGKDCITYTECSQVGSADNVCEDQESSWMGTLSQFQTCVYPAPDLVA